MSNDRLAGFEQVIRAELPVMYRTARRLTLDAAWAEDVVGQALLDAAKAWSTFDGRHPRSWLIKIVHNRFLKDVRRAASQPKTTEMADVDPAGPDAWQELNWKLAGDRIMAELDKLPEEYRLAVQLCDVEELSYEEAADVMSVPKGTVRSRLFRGRRILRDRLSEVLE